MSGESIPYKELFKTRVWFTVHVYNKIMFFNKLHFKIVSKLKKLLQRMCLCEVQICNIEMRFEINIDSIDHQYTIPRTYEQVK